MNDSNFRSGFVAVVGRPNVGKSTLTNALVKDKVAITSAKPQTTRRAIRAIITRENDQIVLVDTPGIHRPRTLLGKRLNDLVRENLSQVDVIGFCLPADQKLGPGDRFISQELINLRKNSYPAIIAIVTKADLVSKEDLAKQLIAVQEFMDFDDIIPVSAAKDIQLEELLNLLASHLPIGPSLYPDDQLTEESINDRIAEYVREAALAGVEAELPHSIAVVVEEVVEESLDGDPFATVAPGEGRLVVRVSLYVERDSQKGIVIGKGGQRLKNVGSKARQDIKRLLGRNVYLEIRVKVAKEWQRDPKQLRRLGF